MNNNQHTQASLLASGKGVFAATDYISIGTAENPFPYVTKEKDRDSYKGKQMLTHVPPSGNNPVDLFGKEHGFIGKDLPYSDRIKYAEEQKDRKPGKGFLTSDFSKRDEFSNTCRTEQYRTQLKSEHKFAKKALDSAVSAPAATLPLDASMTSSFRPKASEGALFFDQVFHSPDCSPQAAAHLTRDTLNPTMLSPERYAGSYQTTTQAAHSTHGDQPKSPYGRTKLVHDTFYRQSNALSFTSLEAQ